MRKLIILLFILIVALTSCKKVNPYIIKSPESVVWNPVTKEYLISNAGSGYILSLKDKKEFSVFNKTKLISPKGMAIGGNSLYVTDITQLVGYNLKDGKETFRYNVPGAMYLNDVAVSHDNLIYASDMKRNAIVTINPATNSGSTFVNKDLVSPNGIYYVQQDTLSLLYIVSYRPEALIQILNLKTREIKPIPNTAISMADGITRDAEGNWLVSSWMDKTIHKFKPDFSARTTLNDKVQSPADIYYCIPNEELAVPLLELNTINFVTQIDTTKANK